MPGPPRTGRTNEPDEARAVVTDIAFPVTYPCHRCGALLEVVADEWRGWVRCPSCGLPSRPPSGRAGGARVGDVMFIGTFSTGPADAEPDAFATKGTPAGPYSKRRLGATPVTADAGTRRRILIGAGFFVAAFLALVSVVQKSPGQAGVFGGVAVLLLFLLARSSAGA